MHRALTTLSLVLLVPFQAQAAAVKLKLAYVFSGTELTYTSSAAPFIKAVNEDPEAKGVVEIVPYPNGALGRIPAEQPQLLLDGVTDIALIVPAFTPGRFPELEALELPGLFRDQREATAVFIALVQSGRVKSFDNFVPLMTTMGPTFGIHSRMPIVNLSELRGKKLRAAGVSFAGALKALDAVPVSVSATELAEALARGTIDGVVTQPTVVYDLQLERIVPYHFNLGMGSLALTLIMHKPVFDRLPAAAQQIIARHSGKALSDRFADAANVYLQELEGKIRKDPKQKIFVPTEAEQAEAYSKFKDVYAAWVEKRPENAGLLSFVEGEIAKFRGPN